MRNRLQRVGLLLAVAVLMASAGFLAQHYLRPEPALTATSALDQRLLPATYRTVRALEEQVSRDEDASAMVRLAAAYLQGAREASDGTYVDRAERLLQRALERDATSYEALNGLGLVSLTRHRFEEALAWGERARALAPRRAAAYGILVDAYIELGRYEEAVAAARRMVNLRPDLASYSRISYLRELHGDLPGAVEAMQRAAEAGSGNVEHTAWCRVYLGHLYFHQGRLDAAAHAYRLALLQLPNYGHALAGLARLHLAHGQFDAAVDAYERAVAVAPIPEYEIALGEAYASAGRTAAAEAAFARALAALEAERAGGMDVDEELALLLLDRNRDLERALALARGAYDRRPTVKNAGILAWAYHRNGRPADALRLAEASLRLGTADALLYFRAGLIAEAAGAPDRARACLEHALALNPYFPRADQARQYLQ